MPRTQPPRDERIAMSLFRMLGDIGYVIGPILMGFIVDIHGANTALFLATFILFSIGIAFARFAPESYKPGM